VTTAPPRPTWAEFWARVGDEDWLAAKALLELSSIRREAESWLRWERDPLYDDSGEPFGYTDPYPVLDWEAWIADYDAEGRGWSSTEHRLFALVAALVIPDRQIAFRSVLGYMGSWETEVWRILTEWGTGGNNREYPGRATVVPVH